MEVKLSLCYINNVLCCEDIWGSGCIAVLFFSSQLDGSEWLASLSDLFTFYKKNRLYPPDRRQCGSQNRWGRCGEEKKLDPDGNRNPTIQPLVYRYTDWDLTFFKSTYCLEFIHLGQKNRFLRKTVNMSILMSMSMSMSITRFVCDII
jgi:hypothetical protein